MRDYFIRRFLLIFPTLIGATMLVFFITRVTPGGPLEKAMMRAMTAGEKSQKDPGGSLSEEQKAELAAYYGFDKPFFPAYLNWLGALPYEADKQYLKFEKDAKDQTITLRELLPKSQWKPNNAYRVSQVSVSQTGKLTNLSPEEYEVSRYGRTVVDPLKSWSTRVKTVEQKDEAGKVVGSYSQVQIYRNHFNGLLQGNLGYSTTYNDPVWDMIKKRMPVSLFYGLATFIMMYVVCIPLGILKAIKHRTVLDNVTSVLIFVGYAIPGFVLGSLLVVYLAARLGWFPTGGFTSENFDSLTFGQKVWDVIHHAILPLICYMVGAFAFMTMLMKNNLMDNLAADYVRTAIAKGASYKQAVLKHALRNSLIPIATTLGHIVSVFVAGSLLIELIFEINGFGLLGYNSIVDRDYPLVMGILFVSVILLTLGNILSDFLVALTDPRVRFE
ncbi:microcin C transport system permease protein [Roseimicrobium gellanilyticum]|uniref:Microcin C transport system permease protein n=1 Tax=Roseimicrobium gellanilyticum TaxID=748857 RepID=A0A366HJQ6_9BACT|nr:ABC transporter permease [Roseimicrobium gellanilyticum]RBP42340.1 microcin C transport system permease protein [Roseimicrobium gellanilyticum]